MGFFKSSMNEAQSNNLNEELYSKFPLLGAVYTNGYVDIRVSGYDEDFVIYEEVTDNVNERYGYVGELEVGFFNYQFKLKEK